MKGMPPLYVYWKTVDKLSNPVNGHAVRCQTIMDYWKRIGGEAYNISGPYQTSSGILLLDTWEFLPLPPRAEMVVSITGTKNRVCHLEDVIISPSYGAEEINYGVKHELKGAKMFVRRIDFDLVTNRENPKGVMFVTGGNKQEYWSLVDKGQAHKIVARNNYNPFFIESISPYHFAGTMAYHSSVVVCPASVSCLEALSLGKLVLLVRTSHDQEINYNNLLRDKLAIKYSPSALEWALSPDSAETRKEISKKAQAANIDGRGHERIAGGIVKAWINEKM